MRYWYSTNDGARASSAAWKRKMSSARVPASVQNAEITAGAGLGNITPRRTNPSLLVTTDTWIGPVPSALRIAASASSGIAGNPNAKNASNTIRSWLVKSEPSNRNRNSVCRGGAAPISLAIKGEMKKKD